MKEPVRRPASPAVHREQKRRRRIRRRNQGIVVLAVLVVLLFGVALVVAGLPAGQGASSHPGITSVIPSSAPASSAPSVPVPPPRTPTIYDEPDMPPLFNFENPISDDYRAGVQLVDAGGGQQLEQRAAQAFLDMEGAASEDGIQLVPLSGYRTYQRQYNNYHASIQRYREWGYSEEEAIARTEGYYAIPGTSEHEVGLAIDIGDATVPAANIQDSFEDTPAFAWLQQHCAEFGFILRYEADTFDITRINYEPWHYRYVGANHAEIIQREGITLEEYVQGDYATQ